MPAACWPKPSNSAGVDQAEIALPAVPMPYSPSAWPWRCGGYHSATNGTPTANSVPDTPSSRPDTSSIS